MMNKEKRRVDKRIFIPTNESKTSLLFELPHLLFIISNQHFEKTGGQKNHGKEITVKATKIK